MENENFQYLIYAGLVIGGILLRHIGLPLPLPTPSLPSSPTPPSSPSSPTPPNGTPTPSLPPGLAESIIRIIDSRLALLEQRLSPQPAPVAPTNDTLAGQLASLSHRLLDRQQTPPPTPPPAS